MKKQRLYLAEIAYPNAKFGLYIKQEQCNIELFRGSIVLILKPD